MNTQYIKTPLGLLNLLLIIVLIPCWISIAAVRKTRYLTVYRTQAEEAYLFFAIFGMIIEIVVFILYLFDLHKKLGSLPMNIILAIKDVVFAIAIFSLAVTSAVYESRQRYYANTYWLVYNRGAFGAGAFFGFVAVILYIVHCVLSLMGKGDKPANVPA